MSELNLVDVVSTTKLLKTNFGHTGCFEALAVDLRKSRGGSKHE